VSHIGVARKTIAYVAFPELKGKVLMLIKPFVARLTKYPRVVLLFTFAITLLLTACSGASEEHYNDARTYFESSDYERAIESLDQAIAKKPDYFLAYDLRALCYTLKNPPDFDRAVADYSQVIQLHPDAVAYHNRANAYLAQAKVGAAINDFTKAIELDPDEAQYYFNRGNAFLFLGEKERIIEDMRQTIALQPNNWKAHHTLAGIYADTGQYDLAIRHYGETIGLRPELSDAYAGRGRAYSEMGMVDQAIADLSTAIKLNPTPIQPYFDRGIAYAQKEEYNLAISDFTQAISLLTEEPASFEYDEDEGFTFIFGDSLKEFDVYYNRGLAYIHVGRLDEAIADFDRVIELKPDHVEAYDGRGVAHFINDESDKAIADYTEAIRLDSFHARAYCNRGVAYYYAGMQAQAISDFRTVLALSDDEGLRRIAETALQELVSP
jgi:tetratricopeptide (TPR) repeat protein